MSKQYFKDIQQLTGCAIILVVVGHLVTGNDIKQDGIEWYRYMKEYIYSFHMPLFIFVSGFLLFYTLPQMKSKSDYKNYIIKKCIRLFPSYLFFALIIFFSKILLSSQLKVDNPVNAYSDFFKVFYLPTKSFAGYLWYIYVLFLYYLTMPIIKKMIRIEIAFLISIPLAFLPFSSYFALDFYFQFLPFCLLGGLAVKHYQKYTSILKRWSFIFLLLFVGASVAFYFFRLPKELMGLLSIPAFHSVILMFKENKLTLFSILGKYTFAIYLMNTIVIGFLKAIGFKYFDFSYQNFGVLFVILIICGLLIPVLVKKYIIKPLPIIGNHIA